ncbi:MAG TPA: tail fiber domain-containing protein [Solirubrobacteraceae bacterium]|jgi:hypothetical protein|nr:tail fiber domain-containing protein [Solirubrobacteraceae bacterium]
MAQSPSRPDRDAEAADPREPYEPPELEELGTMHELTEGMAFAMLDLSGLGPSSDRRLKQAFEPVDVHDILAKVAELPVEAWSYRAQPGVRHIGPMAQDFRAAFGLGEDDRHIQAVDAMGVCLAAIKALAGHVQERDAQISALWAEVEELRAHAPQG